MGDWGPFTLKALLQGWSVSSTTAFASVALILISAVLSVGMAAAQASPPATQQASETQSCEYRHAFASLLAKPSDWYGEFRITLRPPQYRDAASVKQHRVYSTVLARLFWNALTKRTNFQCSGAISNSLFPDLRVFLVARGAKTRSIVTPDFCVRALQDIVADSQPDNAEIKRVSSSEERSLRHRLESPLGPVIEASDILTAAFLRIYPVGSAMYALASVRPRDFQALEPASLRTWLTDQRTTQSVALIPLKLCDPKNKPTRKEIAEGSRLPASPVAPPGPLLLENVNDSGPKRQTYHVVIVGEGPVIGDSRSNPPAIAKYCNHVRSFSETDGTSSRPIAVLIRCFRTVRFDTGWTVFYCDPTSCKNQSVAAEVVSQIANDSAVIALSKIMMPYRGAGPYLVTIADH